MVVLGGIVALLFFLWGFMPIRTFFPYLLLPILLFGILAFLVLVPMSSSMSGF